MRGLICGPKLAACGIVLSTWGVIMLAMLGIFFTTHSAVLIEDVPFTDQDIHQDALWRRVCQSETKNSETFLQFSRCPLCPAPSHQATSVRIAAVGGAAASASGPCSRLLPHGTSRRWRLVSTLLRGSTPCTTRWDTTASSQLLSTSCLDSSPAAR
ncbi:ribonuclease kappa-A isoform X1 [Perca fluviatilis]|uniref:ribonuclease kappa-A isoform X1 n=1 Tax=Perca fluviatilis TaxID=8168 RepID=UPI0019643616|nr:ribonuclease kappa-A isoform X1 [Perca fluviatilis]